MKNSNDTIGNQTRDLPVCSAVPQPTALPAACPQYLRCTRRILNGILLMLHRNFVLFLMFNQIYRNNHIKFVPFYCRDLYLSKRKKQQTDTNRYESVTQTWVLLVDKQAASTTRLCKTFYHNKPRKTSGLYRADSRQDDKFQEIIPHAAWNFLLRNSALHSGRP